MKNQRSSPNILSLTCLMAVFSACLTTAVPGRSEAQADKNELQNLVDNMQPGWNLGNAFDAIGGETAWGNPLTTKAMIEQIAAAGFKSIRIPVTWDQRMGPAPEYAIDPDFMKRIQEAADWSLEAGLTVIMDLHHDSRWIMNMEADREQVLNKFKAAWTQIAGHFKGYPDQLLFESINEPRFSEDWGKDTAAYFDMAEELHTSFVKIVRSSGNRNARRPLVLTTLTGGTSQKRLDELVKTMDKLHDDRLIATIHYYGFYPFSVNLGGATTFNEEVRKDVEQTFDRAYDTFVSKGIPVIVGEYGLLGFDKSLDTIEHGEVLKYFDYVNAYARQKELTLMLWDNGQHFDRRALQWHDESLFNVMKASWNGRSSNAGSDMIFLKKGEDIQDVRLPLQLNGNTLAEIRNGDHALSEGADYVRNGDQLILKADYLKSLATDNLGVQASLVLRFSAGADWKIEVIRSDIPRLQSAEGAGADLAIPTKFNGDRLAAMEARYASGSPAGPDDWTPFKEFNSSFSPQYDGKAIILKKRFFEQLKDGETMLKMHFWSGETIDYKIVKEQSKVVGTSSQDPVEPAGGDDESSPVDGPVHTQPAPPVSTTNSTPTETGTNFGLSLTSLIIAGTCLLLLLAGLVAYRAKKQ